MNASRPRKLSWYGEISLTGASLTWDSSADGDHLDVYADDDDRLGRVISRDILERGRSVDKVLQRYSKSVKPMHLQFIEPSKIYADIIIPQGGHNKVAIEILSTIIEKNLNKFK